MPYNIEELILFFIKKFFYFFRDARYERQKSSSFNFITII